MSKKPRKPSKKSKKKTQHRTAPTRRDFLGAAGAVAGVYLVGCSSDGEPIVPPTPQPVDDTRIVRAAIYPGIGVARVGNSTEENGYFIGPEVPEPEQTVAGVSRDASGAIKRQAARFRIYGYNAAGQVVSELTADEADIEWQVHLANKKAQWYRFSAALDLPEAAGELRCPLRNAAVTGNDRAALAIDPGPRLIAGRGEKGAQYHFDGAEFEGEPVPLGELRTDDAGRLLVLGGHGKSGSPRGTPVFDPENPDTFNNADGWFDDISDGPVRATVRIGGEEIPVESSWVFVGPPNYAPDVISWRTLYDLLVDTYVGAGMLPMPEETSFARHVLPALKRLTGLQWVNKGFADRYGYGTDFDFEDPEFIAKLNRKPAPGERDPHAELRQSLLAQFREPNLQTQERRKWPYIYGDAFGSFDGSPRNDLAPSDLRAHHLRNWAEGNFVPDWEPDRRPPRSLDEVPVADQPLLLDQAALHYCLADAFHPGCEVTWPMRHASMYRAPFRVNERDPGMRERDYGAELTSDVVLERSGPLHAQGPGDLTRWMAVPWQGDTVFCRSGYEPQFDPFIPTFWPARVPNHVLSEEDYKIVTDPKRIEAEQRALKEGFETQAARLRQVRINAFRRRAHWVRAMTGDGPSQIKQMVKEFGLMGIVEARPGIANDPDFPEVMLVESLPKGRDSDLAARSVAPQFEAAAAAEALDERGRAVREAGWDSEEQLEEFRRIMGLK